MRTIVVDEKLLKNLYIGDNFTIPSFPVEIQSTEVSARAGAVYMGKKIGTLEVEIPMIYQNVDMIDTKKVNDLLINYFNYDNEVSIHIENEDWYWMGYVYGDFNFPLDIKPFYTFTLKVKLLTPYKYSLAEFSNTAMLDQIGVVNTGTVETFPVIEATALKDTTHIMIAKNDDDYIMLGEQPNANKTIRKVSPVVLKDNLSNVSGWYYIENTGNTFADNETGGVLGAYVTSIGSGMFVRDNKYPAAPDQWIGAGVKKAMSRNVQDFEHKFTIKIYEDDVAVNKLGTGKVFTHLWDETGKLVASIGLVDASYNSNDLQLIAKLYDQTGAPKTIVKFKPKYDAYLDDFVYCSIKRVGNKWTFKANTIKKIRMKTRRDIAKYGQTREVVRNTHTETYTDKYKRYTAPVRTASIYIARYDWASKTMVEKDKFKAGAYDISTVEVTPKASTEVDMLIEQGDKIVIDNFNQTMTINKKSALQHKDFGSNYFGLEKGQHELFVYPKNAFDVTVRWQNVDY
ncbi:phage distal tail protein [Macrococcoides caseolyticum]|uniref:phage distal tail protein n=1 Tax=Macrococcoides caseolyticum TaxID=69966 RepID=UPI001F3BA5D8|nr:phage tail domain-containing protein [Macrococcus caseolyticus]MCE4957251.1 phage tail family protein [Macrococcus caseolyticus]